MSHRAYCEGCRRPASRTRWEFARDPEGRLCASCVADGVSLRQTRERPDAPEAGRFLHSKQGNTVFRLDADCMARLREMHAAKLRGDIEPLTRRDELSVYNPNGRSCLRNGSGRREYRPTAQRVADVRPLRRRETVERLHANGA